MCINIFCVSAHIILHSWKKADTDFQPRWKHRQKCFASLHNQKKDNNQSKNNKQPEVQENQTVWKSDNQ